MNLLMGFPHGTGGLCQHACGSARQEGKCSLAVPNEMLAFGYSQTS